MVHELPEFKIPGSDKTQKAESIQIGVLTSILEIVCETRVEIDICRFKQIKNPKASVNHNYSGFAIRRRKILNGPRLSL